MAEKSDRSLQALADCDFKGHADERVDRSFTKDGTHYNARDNQDGRRISWQLVIPVEMQLASLRLASVRWGVQISRKPHHIAMVEPMSRPISAGLTEGFHTARIFPFVLIDY
jgi:hypothetical protein